MTPSYQAAFTNAAWLAVSSKVFHTRWTPIYPRSLSVLEVRLVIVLVPGFGCGVCLAGPGGRVAAPGVSGCAPRRAVPPFLSLGLMVLVTQVLAGRRAAASR
jgi:hypothetical protein